MYKGHWYDVAGKERTDLLVMSILPDTKLIVINENLGRGFISIEETSRMLICKD